MNKYNKSIVYKISSPHTNDIYVGSSTKNEKTRFKEHDSAYNKHLTDPVKTKYCYSFEIMRLGDCEITVLERVNVNTKKELRMRENYYYDTLDNVINKNRPFSTPEDAKKREKKYREEHQIAIKERKKNDYEKNKEKYQEKNKEYYETNKEEIHKHAKIYKEKNKEKIKLNKNKPINCVCGMTIQNSNLSRHKNKSEFHKNFVSQHPNLKR